MILKRKLIRQGLFGLLAGLILFIAFVGYLHTPSGRKLPIARTLLTAMGYSCPADAMDSTEMDSVRKYVASKSSHLPSAAKKNALSFQIGISYESEVRDWISNNKVQCTSGSRGYNFIKCKDIESFPSTWKNKGPISEVDFSFSKSGQLVAIDILRRKMTPSQGYLTTKNILTELESSLGKPSLSSGKLTDDSFKKNFETFIAEYNYRDYTARVSTSVLPHSGVVIYEQYLSLE